MRAFVLILLCFVCSAFGSNCYGHDGYTYPSLSACQTGCDFFVEPGCICNPDPNSNDWICHDISKTTTSAPQHPPSCARDWTYYEKSNKCFKIFGGSFDGIATTTWTSAMQYCNRFSRGHLASFHSDDEIAFVVELASIALSYDDGYGAPLHTGLSYGSNNWAWVDGSRLTYTKWFNNQEAVNNSIARRNPAGILHTQRGYTSTMHMTDYYTRYAFVCQTPPISEG